MIVAKPFRAMSTTTRQQSPGVDKHLSLVYLKNKKKFFRSSHTNQATGWVGWQGSFLPSVQRFFNAKQQSAKRVAATAAQAKPLGRRGRVDRSASERRTYRHTYTCTSEVLMIRGDGRQRPPPPPSRPQPHRTAPRRAAIRTCNTAPHRTVPYRTAPYRTVPLRSRAPSL